MTDEDVRRNLELKEEGPASPHKVKVSLVEDQHLAEEVRGSLQNYVMKLGIPQKVELAAKGNREVRSILSRDANTMVARAVIESPRLSEADVLAYVGSPLTNEEILRAVAENREYARNSRIVTLLVINPRTPPALALRFLGHLPSKELNLLARNRNISPIVRREAKRRAMLARR